MVPSSTPRPATPLMLLKTLSGSSSENASTALCRLTSAASSRSRQHTSSTWPSPHPVLLVFGALKAVLDFQWSSILTSSAISPRSSASHEDTIAAWSRASYQPRSPSPRRWIASRPKGWSSRPWRYTKIQPSRRTTSSYQQLHLQDTLVNYSWPSCSAHRVGRAGPEVPVKSSRHSGGVRGARWCRDARAVQPRRRDPGDASSRRDLLRPRYRTCARPRTRSSAPSGTVPQARIELPYPVTEMRT